MVAGGALENQAHITVSRIMISGVHTMQYAEMDSDFYCPPIPGRSVLRTTKGQMSRIISLRTLTKISLHFYGRNQHDSADKEFFFGGYCEIGKPLYCTISTTRFVVFMCEIQIVFGGIKCEGPQGPHSLSHCTVYTPKKFSPAYAPALKQKRSFRMHHS